MPNELRLAINSEKHRVVLGDRQAAATVTGYLKSRLAITTQQRCILLVSLCQLYCGDARERGLRVQHECNLYRRIRPDKTSAKTAVCARADYEEALGLSQRQAADFPGPESPIRENRSRDSKSAVGLGKAIRSQIVRVKSEGRECLHGAECHCGSDPSPSAPTQRNPDRYTPNATFVNRDRLPVLPLQDNSGPGGRCECSLYLELPGRRRIYDGTLTERNRYLAPRRTRLNLRPVFPDLANSRLSGKNHNKCQQGVPSDFRHGARVHPLPKLVTLMRAPENQLRTGRKDARNRSRR